MEYTSHVKVIISQGILAFRCFDFLLIVGKFGVRFAFTFFFPPAIFVGELVLWLLF